MQAVTLALLELSSGRRRIMLALFGSAQASADLDPAAGYVAPFGGALLCVLGLLLDGIPPLPAPFRGDAFHRSSQIKKTLFLEATSVLTLSKVPTDGHGIHKHET